VYRRAHPVLDEEGEAASQGRQGIHLESHRSARSTCLEERWPIDIARAERRMPVTVAVVVCPMQVQNVRFHPLQPRLGREVAVHMCMSDIEAQAESVVADSLEEFFEDCPVGLPLVFQADFHARMRREHVAPKGGVTIEELRAVARSTNQRIEAEVKYDFPATEPRGSEDVALDPAARQAGYGGIRAMKCEIEKYAVKRAAPAEIGKLFRKLALEVGAGGGVIQWRTGEEGRDFQSELMLLRKGDTLRAQIRTEWNEELEAGEVARTPEIRISHSDLVSVSRQSQPVAKSGEAEVLEPGIGGWAFKMRRATPKHGIRNTEKKWLDPALRKSRWRTHGSSSKLKIV